MRYQFSSFLILGRVRRFVGALAFLTVAAISDVGAQVTYPSEMPGTPMPNFKGCSDEQEDFLRKAWRRAHYFTSSATKLSSFIQSRPIGERSELWNRDFSNSEFSPAVSRWFGT